MNINETRNLSGNTNNALFPAGGESLTGDQLNNQFMTLLVAQIQNQDPLNPADGTEFVSQMAQLSQVQSTENMAKMLTRNAMQMEKMQAMATANLVGQKVMVESSVVELDKQPQSGRLTLQQAASSVAIYLTDESGLDHRIALGEQSAGNVDFTIDPAQHNLKPGKYQLSVVSSSGEEFIPLELAGAVNSVRIPPQGGAAQLNIAGIGDVSYSKIKQFGF
ncbi:flagellar hook assembly protein FlgD [Yersinia alsatica]|uniref:flagellar hook assembly protein FlgD n=1 Tax=Yersinia alsatica TaxID=2890317 RepID=UPI000B41E937|nr:flagellar hook assembly protein FlgD [Yersinia alsatica]OVZ88971.1 flagellar basal body rod modification protein [Yersinia frederiksenii]